MSENTDPYYVQAKIDLINEQTLGQRHDNALSEALARTAIIAADREEQKRKAELLTGEQYRVAYLVDVIDDERAGATIDLITRWHREDHDDNRPYTIVMTTPGGSIMAGFQLYSFLRGISEVRPLRIVASGMVASMGTIIHQAASPGLRVIEPECTYLLHKMSVSGLAGRSDQIMDTTEWIKATNDRIMKIYAHSSGGIKTAEDFETELDRRERYMDTDEVLAWGLADEVGYAVQ